MLTVAGLTPSLDLTYLVDHLRLGEIHRPSELVACAGGKSLNLARAAATLGADVSVVAVLGGPTGEHVARLLAADGVHAQVIESPVETRTCVSVASASTSELTEVYQYAPAMPAPVWARVLTATARELDVRPGWLAISGAPPAELPDEALAQLIGLAHERGVRVALDTHGPALGAALDVRPELVKVNRVEAAELLDVDAATADLAELAALVRARTGGAVVLTDGAHGSLGLDASSPAVSSADGPDTVWRVAAPTRLGAYPVGSGDSYLGGLVTALDAGRPLSEALRLGAAAGAANALVPGPGRLDPATVAELAAGPEIARSPS